MKWDVVIPGFTADKPKETHQSVQGASYRTLFLSDLHLGARAFQAEVMLEFLKHSDAETIYLVGDIIDFWRMRRSPFWPQSHNDVVQKLLRKVRKGSRIIYVPGNHDEALRGYCGMHFGGIELHHEFIHTTADGRRFLVIHGDEFDVVVRYAKWLAFLGDRSYELLLWLNYPLNWARKRLGFGYWSLSSFLKLRVKQAVNFIGEFELALGEEAARLDVDGVICGHIHHAANHQSNGIQYVNCGDWVESCTAIAEDFDGQLHLIRWPQVREAALNSQETPVNSPDATNNAPASMTPLSGTKKSVSLDKRPTAEAADAQYVAHENVSLAPEMTDSKIKHRNSNTGGAFG